VSRWGLGTHAGRPAIRRFLGDWFETLDEYEVRVEKILDLGNGVVHAEVLQIARPPGGGRPLRLRSAPVFVWVDGVVARLTLYPDSGEARAAAERLAESRASDVVAERGDRRRV
jgi:ketosteroid isomerase-like protein